MHIAYKALWNRVKTEVKEDADVSKMLCLSWNQFLDENNTTELYLYPKERVPFPLLNNLQHDLWQNLESDITCYIVPEFAYQFATTAVPPHYLDLNSWVPVVVIREVLRPAVVKKKLFIVMPLDHHTMQVAPFNFNGQVLEPKVLHRINFQLSSAHNRRI